MGKGEFVLLKRGNEKKYTLFSEDWTYYRPRLPLDAVLLSHSDQKIQHKKILKQLSTAVIYERLKNNFIKFLYNYNTLCI